MSGIERVTGPLLDVLEVLVAALGRDAELHGWDIMRTVHRSGPTVYRVLDRLEDAKWVTSRWEEANPDPSKPRRRMYSLTPDGLASARSLLAERRPASAGRSLGVPRPATSFGALNRWRALGTPGGAS